LTVIDCQPVRVNGLDNLSLLADGRYSVMD
jgi:hypothetical protein